MKKRVLVFLLTLMLLLLTVEPAFSQILAR